MNKDNAFHGQTLKTLLAQKELLRHFYYGSDLQYREIRKFYKSVLKSIKKELKQAIKAQKKK